MVVYIDFSIHTTTLQFKMVAQNQKSIYATIYLSIPHVWRCKSNLMVVQIQLSAYTTTIRLQKSKKHQNTRFPKTNIPKIRPWKVPEAFVFLRQILYSSHNTSSNLQIQLTTHKEFINNSFRIIPQKSAPPFPYPFLVLPRPSLVLPSPFLPSSSHPHFLPTVLPPRAFSYAIIPLYKQSQSIVVDFY